jgi:hypothetical protein
MTSSIELKPTSQDNLLEQVSEFFRGIAFAGLSLLTLFNSGMGSGKSNIMATLPTVLRGFTGILFVLEKNMHLKNQIMESFRKSIVNNKMYLIDQEGTGIDIKIRVALSKSLIPVIFLKNVAHKGGSLNKAAILLENIAKSFPQVDKLAFIDELDNQLTSLTGGINAKLDHPSGIMEEYVRVVSQNISLNTFDMLRKYRVKVFGFSGTLNNTVCSKLPSLGYKASDILIVNVYPIETLYNNLNIVPIDIRDFTSIAPYLQDAEHMVDKKILIAFPDTKSMTEFKRKYAMHFGRTISSVKITGDNEKERMSEEWKDEFKLAKYVFGVNIITTGFDLSTWVEGQEFSLGILYRKLSDKISQPLSKNDEHTLHMDTAASLMQLLARLRKGGTFLIPSQLDGRALFDRLVEVFDRIKNGVNEYSWVGGVAGVTQEERHHQCLVIALIQNLKTRNRPIVKGILSDLTSITGRDFEEEMKENLETPSSFDHVFWTRWTGCLWKNYLIDHEQFITSEEKQVKKVDNISRHRLGITTTSGGLRNERIVDERIKDEIIQRSDNICGHCGEKFEEEYSPQDCHIKRHDDKGQYAKDNIIRGHSSCDTMFDNDGLIVYNPSGNGVFLKRNAKINEPHRKQLEGISVANFNARWNWEKNRQGQPHLSDDEFIGFLKAKGYVYKAY